MNEALLKISEAWDEESRIRQERTPPEGPLPYCYASAWKPCQRAMVLDLLAPENNSGHNVQTLGRFDRGEEVERWIVAKLGLSGRHRGFTVQSGQKRYEILGRNGKPAIVGKVDAAVVFDDKSVPVIPFDVKSGAAILHIETLADVEAGRWTRGMKYQVLSYLYGEGVETGFLLLDKPSGPVLIEIRLPEHLEDMERFLTMAEAAVDIASSPDPSLRVLPEFHGDKSECLTCSHFQRSCAPPMEYGEGMQMILDPDMLEAAETVEETREDYKRYGRAWKKLTSGLRGVELGSLGGIFDVVGKWGKSSKKNWPDACPSCSCPIEPDITTNPKGRFTLDVTRAGEGE